MVQKNQRSYHGEKNMVKKLKGDVMAKNVLSKTEGNVLATNV